MWAATEAGTDKDEQAAGGDFLSSFTESWRCTEEFLVPSTDTEEQWYECDPELQPPVKQRRRKDWWGKTGKDGLLGEKRKKLRKIN